MIEKLLIRVGYMQYLHLGMSGWPRPIAAVRVEDPWRRVRPVLQWSTGPREMDQYRGQSR